VTVLFYSPPLEHPHQFCGNFKAARPRFDTPLILRSLYSFQEHNAVQFWRTQSTHQLSPREGILATGRDLAG
jgi:hypothetical protein